MWHNDKSKVLFTVLTAAVVVAGVLTAKALFNQMGRDVPDSPSLPTSGIVLEKKHLQPGDPRGQTPGDVGEHFQLPFQVKIEGPNGKGYWLPTTQDGFEQAEVGKHWINPRGQ